MNPLYKLMMIPHQLTYDYYRSKYDIVESFKFNGPGIRLSGKGLIQLGENSYIGRYSSIGSQKNCTVKIGDDCRIAHMVQLFTHGIRSDQDLSNPDPVYEYGDIFVEDYCWIGAQTIILPDVVIGENSIIGANSTVTHDIPSYSVAVGSPCRVIKKGRLNHE